MIRRIVDSPIVGDTFRFTINNNLKRIFYGRGKITKRKSMTCPVCASRVFKKLLPRYVYSDGDRDIRVRDLMN